MTTYEKKIDGETPIARPEQGTITDALSLITGAKVEHTAMGLLDGNKALIKIEPSENEEFFGKMDTHYYELRLGNSYEELSYELQAINRTLYNGFELPDRKELKAKASLLNAIIGRKREELKINGLPIPKILTPEELEYERYKSDVANGKIKENSSHASQLRIRIIMAREVGI